MGNIIGHYMTTIVYTAAKWLHQNSQMCSTMLSLKIKMTQVRILGSQTKYWLHRVFLRELICDTELPNFVNQLTPAMLDHGC